MPSKTSCTVLSRCILFLFFAIVIFTIKQLFVVNYNICIQVTSKFRGQYIYTFYFSWPNSGAIEHHMTCPTAYLDTE